MQVPQVTARIPDSNNEIQYLIVVHTYGDKNEIPPSQVQQPPQVITIQESDEASLTELEFNGDESTSGEKVHH